jgi:hypothetical protein
MNPADKDNSGKILLGKILWNMGYSTRFNVKISGFETGQPSGFELTDIDVFGIKVLEEYRLEHALADCSTQKLSPINRALRLRGLLDLMNGSYGYICLEREAPASHKEIAHRLNITLLTPEHFEELEKRFRGRRRASETLFLAQYHEVLEKGISELPKPFETLLEFRKSVYWITPHFRSLQQLIGLTRDVSSKLDPRQKFHRALGWDLAGLLAISTLHVCSQLFHTLPKSYAESLRAYLHGDYFSQRAREQLLTSMKEIFRHAAQSDMFASKGIEKALGRLSLDPPYFNELLELVLRFNNRIEAARDLPRYFQLIVSQALTSKPESPETILGPEYSEYTMKFVDDLRLFFQKSAELPKGLLALPTEVAEEKERRAPAKDAKEKEQSA